MRPRTPFPAAALLAVPLLAACSSAAPPAGTPAPVPPPGSSAPATASPAPTASSAPSATPAATAASASTPARPSGSASASSTAAAPGRAGTLVDYRRTAGQEGVAVRSDADLARLSDAPDAFKAFVKAELAREKQTNGPSCNSTVGVTVLRTDGYAVGYTSGCGGAAMAWAVQQGAWKQVWGGQELAPCAPFRAIGFPADVYAGLGSDTCQEGGRPVTYRP